MDTIAKVVRVNGQLMGEVLRSEACAKCGACSHGLEEKRYYPLPEGEWHEGDQVTISLPGHQRLRRPASWPTAFPWPGC